MTKLRWLFVLVVAAIVQFNPPVHADPIYCSQLCGPDLPCETSCLADGSMNSNCWDYTSGACQGGNPTCNPSPHSSIVTTVGYQPTYWYDFYGHLNCVMIVNHLWLRHDSNGCSSDFYYCGNDYAWQTWIYDAYEGQCENTYQTFGSLEECPY